jgi:CheY-like chemotaxis protein
MIRGTTEGRILLIEDLPGHAQDLVETLGMRGYRIERVRGGTEAIARAQDTRPDIAVADISDPQGESLKSAETLGWVDGLPCILVVGLPSLVTHHLMASMSFLKCVLWRPYGKEALVRAVEEALHSEGVVAPRAARSP